MNKTELRQKYKIIRKQIGGKDEKARQTAQLFLSLFSFDKDDVIALYYPVQSEMSTKKLWHELQVKGLQCALPVIQNDSRILNFASWQDDTEFAPNKYGITQPQSLQFITPNFVIVPMLAFDMRGTRLGYGGGYYDTTLQSLRESGKVTAIGLAFEAQKCSFNLPVEVHDQKLDCVVTENNIYRF